MDHQVTSLPAWALAQVADALPAYLRSRPEGWPLPAAGETPAAFLSRFTLHEPQDGNPALFTGYYEPVLEARLQPEGRFTHPLYALPSDPHVAHAAITAGALAGQGLEIAYVADPVEAFFLQVQGSGRLDLGAGQSLRLGYAGKNGFPYRSLGKEMIARGLIPAEQMSADAIRAYLAAHPDEVAELLHSNESFVYFKVLDLPPADGPIGTSGVPLSDLRSLAVDLAHIPLGALVLLETMIDGQPVQRLMVAQDTGGVIKGAQRADIYFGTGLEAGLRAGAQQAGGRMRVLLPARTGGA